LYKNLYRATDKREYRGFVLVKKEERKIEDIAQCPECRSNQLGKDYSRAELVCRNCGFILDENMIDQGPEWRAYDSEQQEKRARTGAPMTYTIHDMGLNTTIGWKNRDSYGKAIPPRNCGQIYRLRKLHQRIQINTATERNLATALSALGRLASRMGLPRTVRETAAMIYRKAVSQNLVRGRTIDGVATTALYAACRQCNVPRSLDEIAASSQISRKEIGRTYRVLSRELRLKLLPTSPGDYVSRFCSELKFSGNVGAKTEEIVKEAEHRELTIGCSPMGIAAASLYIASVLCGERRTQEEIATVTGVTAVTIRNRYKELAKNLDIHINP
jgi:transcription initiation factor TFIIB